MSYTPHTWAAGDTVTSARLNALEQGIDEWDDLAPLIVNRTTQEQASSTQNSQNMLRASIQNPVYLDKTVGEILEAFQSGIKVIIKNTYTVYDYDASVFYIVTDVYLSYYEQDPCWQFTLNTSNGYYSVSSYTSYEDLLSQYPTKER